MFFFNFDNFQIAGSSPEILVRVRDKQITIRPIAGTRPRGKNNKDDIRLKKELLNDKKEMSWKTNPHSLKRIVFFREKIIQIY